MDIKRILRRIDLLRIPIRERLNPLFGWWRKRKLNNRNFTIISNNCWAAHVYRYFQIPYTTPTIGLYFFGDEYVKFVSNLEKYCKCHLVFINPKESKHYQQLIKQGSDHSLIGKLDDVEIVFLHYETEQEALDKWTRRTKRIIWDNLIIKFSAQNDASPEQLKIVDALPYNKKIIFTTKDLGLKSQVIFKEYEGDDQIADEITHFRRYVNLIELVNRN